MMPIEKCNKCKGNLIFQRANHPYYIGAWICDKCRRIVYGDFVTDNNGEIFCNTVQRAKVRTAKTFSFE